MKFLKAILSAIPLIAVLACTFTFDSHPDITWFGLGALASLIFALINVINGNASAEDLLPGLLLVSLGLFSALMVSVLGFVSLGNPEKRAAYIADQVSRESRSGIFG